MPVKVLYVKPGITVAPLVRKPKEDEFALKPLNERKNVDQ